MDDQSLTELDVIIPNLHWRYSGVTATNRMIAPRLARLHKAAWLGRDAPEGIEPVTISRAAAAAHPAGQRGRASGTPAATTK